MNTLRIGKTLRTATLLVAGLGLTACASVDQTVSRNTPFEMVVSDTTVDAPISASVSIADYNIRVSRSLRVSEANTYYPLGDIVWRGEAPGDRHAQVAKIFQDSVLKVQADTAEGALPVIVDLELKRFHALTERTRYTIGGIHNIVFDFTVRDAATGDVIAPTRQIEANLRGFGGSKAVAAERLGMGQRVRITQHIANVVAQELAVPGSAGEKLVELVDGLEVNVVDPTIAGPESTDEYVQL